MQQLVKINNMQANQIIQLQFQMMVAMVQSPDMPHNQYQYQCQQPQYNVCKGNCRMPLLFYRRHPQSKFVVPVGEQWLGPPSPALPRSQSYLARNHVVVGVVVVGIVINEGV